jgi:hypothetical protein
VKPSYSMALYKHKSIRNKRCGSNKCKNQANRRVLFSLGFSAFFCEKCADELIRSNLGTEEESTDISAAKHANIADESLIGENE